MFAKVVIALALFALAQAGHDAPPPKTHTYNVPSVSKVSYPGAAVTKSVETYSAPSIEKTTTITRTITAPLNAPAVRSVSYAAPSAPILAAGPVGYAAAPVGLGYGAPAVGLGGYGGYAAPIGLAGYGGYAAAPIAYAGHGHYGLAGGIGLQTTYSAPSLGYSLGAPALAVAPAPVLAAPVAKYGAPAVAVKEVKGGY